MRNLGKHLGVFVVCCAATSLASSKTLIVGTGDCLEETFLQDIKLLTNLAQKRDDITPIPLTPLFEKRKLQSFQPTQEEQRMLATVHSKILQADYSAAFRDIQWILDTLEKSVPSFESWQLTAKALAMRGFALSKQKKARASEEAFLAILKLDSTYQLDRLIFPPTVVQSFERLRQALSKRKKASLSLASFPDGANVFVNGAPLGQTPLEQELLPGYYRIILEREGKISNPVVVNLSPGNPIAIDISFQWNAAWLTPFCIQEEGELALLFSKKMAEEFGADHLLKLDMLAAGSKKKGVRAALIDLHRGEVIREGGVQLEDGQREGPLSQLINFVASGKLDRDDNVVWPVNSQGELIEPLALHKLSPSQESVSPSALPPDATQAKVVRGNTARVVSWVLIGAGGASIVVGGLAEVRAVTIASDMKNILQKYGGDENTTHSSSDGPRYRALLSQKRNSEQIGIIMGATGLASLATGLILFFTLPPKIEKSPAVSIAPHFGTDGGGIALRGRF